MYNDDGFFVPERIIAIGDIHGCYYTLKALFDKLDYDDSRDQIVFLGDYIDRGYHSCQTVKFIRQLEVDHGTKSIIALRGNHEQMAIDADGDYSDLWFANDGHMTTYDYEFHDKRLKTDIRWFEKLHLKYAKWGYLFCHAGLKSVTVKENTQEDFLWARDWIKNDSRPREKRVICGHTPQKKVPFYTPSGSIIIDGGCVFGRSLCAAIVTKENEPEFILQDFVERDKGW